MKTQNQSDFAKVMTAIAELYGKKISPTLLSIYWTALERFSLHSIKKAIAHHVNDTDVGQFMPKPADIARYLEGNNETKALQAWSKVESAIRHIGAYETVVFDDSIIHVVLIEMGGWAKICSTSNEEMPFKANEFIKRYQGYLRNRPENFPKQLIGTFDHANRASGHSKAASSTPVLIGEENKALQILSRGSNTSMLKIRHNHSTVADIIKDQVDGQLYLENDKEEHE